MLVSAFVSAMKRETRYGDPAVTDDTPTADVVDKINVRRKRIWSKWDWKWAREPLSFAVTPGTSDYVVHATAGAAVIVDRILDIIPNDPAVSPAVTGKPLDEVDYREFYTWLATEPDAPSVPTKYINLGLNAAGFWQVRIWPSPASAFTMHGYAKKVLTTYTVADIAAGTAFDYFPDGVVDNVLRDGVKSLLYEIQGEKVEAARLDLSFENKLNELVQEQAGVATDDSGVTSPPPDSYRWAKRMRGGTGVY